MLNRHLLKSLALAALIVELSTAGAISTFMIASITGNPALAYA